MTLPKLLIRLLRPIIIVLALMMAYLAYQKLIVSEQRAYAQSRENIDMAAQLISSQVEAAVSKLYLLEELGDNKRLNDIATSFMHNMPAYADIIIYDYSTQSYESVRNLPPPVTPLNTLTWSPLYQYADMIWISSIYQRKPGQWVFAAKYVTSSSRDIWMEFDLIGLTQNLKGLRTLSHGYVFAVDRTTGRLVFHPNSQRIGTESISYAAGIKNLIQAGETRGTYEYYYQNKFKIASYSTNSAFNWVFISGTDRSDILSTSHQFSLTGVILASLVLITIAVNYLLHNLNQNLGKLNGIRNIADYKSHLRLLFDRFCYHQGVQFCLYDQQSGDYSVVDYHGNQQKVHNSCTLQQQFKRGELIYTSKYYADELARKLKISGRHYTIPLFNDSGLIAIIYLQAKLPTRQMVLKMIQNYGELSLINLLLNKTMLNKDVMTNLDNKLTIRAKLDSRLGEQNTFFALMDIDHFKRINDSLGHHFGDAVIKHTAKLMKKSFPIPKAVSLARYGGEEFCILFNANDENHAYDMCEMLRHMVETSLVEFDGKQTQYHVSIGITNVIESQHATIGRADKALRQAKSFGRNQVILNTFS